MRVGLRRDAGEPTFLFPTRDAKRGEMPEEVGTQETNQDQPQGDGQQSTGQDQPQAPATFDDWLPTQSEPVKTMIAGHIGGLQSALSSERTERKKLATQLRELGEKAEEGSDLRKQIEDLTGQVESSDRRADFYEAATIAGITGQSIKLAWIAAKDDELFDEFIDRRSKKMDYPGMFERIKTDYPNLFSKQPAPLPRGNAGSGAGTQSANGPVDMNTLIRKAAGRA